MARKGRFGWPAQSAGVCRNPRKYAGTGAIRQKKSQPIRVGILRIGGGMVPRIKRLLKVRDTGVLASCEALRTGAKSGG